MRVKRKLGDLIRDETIYPRGGVDHDRVLLLCEAHQAKRKLPPIHIDQKNRILDGWHRRDCLAMECSLNTEVECIIHQCRDDGEALKLAVKLNAAHGLPLSRQDRARCLRMASRFGIGAAAMAAMLGTTVLALKARGEGRVAVVQRTPPVIGVPSPIPSPFTREPKETTPDRQEPQEEVILNRTVEHLSGRTITEHQAAATRQLSGLPQIKLVDDLILLLESDTLDRGNERLMERLRKLAEELDRLFASAPVA